MTHTPGPWIWFDMKSGSAGERDPKGIPYLARTGTAEMLLLLGEEDLQVLAVDVARSSGFPKPADAYLISAAPDLLEACKIALEELDNFSVYDVESYAAIKAAVDKAQGIKGS